MKTFTDWLAEVQRKNQLTVENINIGNQFENVRYELRSPDKSIPTVYISVNDEGEISLFDTDVFHFSRFNIAEGFTEENFRSAVISFLNNEIKVRKNILGQKYVELQFEKLVAYGKAKRGKH
jgi:hypothetical protein